MPLLTKPTWAKPTDRWVPQAEKFAPIKNLPDGRVLGTIQKRRDVTAESIIGRLGVVGALNYDASPGVSHRFHHAFDVWELINTQAGGSYGHGQAHLWTREQVRRAAELYAKSPIEGNDFGEGLDYFAPDSQTALWWYQRRKEVYAESGTTRRDYGHHGCTIGLQTAFWYDNTGGKIAPTHAYFRNRFQSVAAARDGIGYFNLSIDGQRYEDLVGYNVKHFAETFDYARNYYTKRYAIEIMGKGMGKVGGLGPGFLVYNDWAKIEGIGDSNPKTINANHFYRRRIDNPAGTVRTGDCHAQVDYDWQVGCYLIMGLCYSDGITIFDIPNRFGVDPSKMPALNTPGPGNDKVVGIFWEPDQAGTAAPVSADGYPFEPCRWHDAAYEAASFYAQFDRTAGEQWKPCSYRFQGSETWIDPPSDGASILEHAAAFDGPHSEAQGARRGRPTVDGRRKNDAFDFVAFDASRSKYYSETILVRVPGSENQIPTTIRGCKPNAHRETV